MAENPDLFVRVSTPAGHFTVPAAVVEDADSSWRVLKGDALDQFGKPLPPKLRDDIAAATPADAEADAKADTSEEK